MSWPCGAWPAASCSRPSRSWRGPLQAPVRRTAARRRPVPLGAAPRPAGRCVRSGTSRPASRRSRSPSTPAPPRTQGNGFDRGVFDILKRERVPATIFVSGRWVESHPDAMAELAREPLIEFGDHSYDHPHMSRLPAARIDAEIDQTEAALGRYGKRAVAFRPPFGDWNRAADRRGARSGGCRR